MRALVTGGAGFIGSRLGISPIKKRHQVIALDDLNLGYVWYLVDFMGKDGFEFVKDDWRKKVDARITLGNVGIVFHLAARPDVRLCRGYPWNCFTENVLATEVLLKATGSCGASKFVFTPSSTLCGDATVIPTPEDYSSLLPISPYGDAELASEAILSGHSNSFGFDVLVLRLANTVGEESMHGIVQTSSRS